MVLKDFSLFLNLDLGHFKEIQGKKKLDPRQKGLLGFEKMKFGGKSMSADGNVGW